MNYQNQYPFNNPYVNRKKSRSTYLLKVSRQLAGILIILLVLLLLKFVKNNTTNVVNNKIKDIINLDYTTEAKAVIANNSPNFSDYIDKFLNKFKTNKEFNLDYLPISGKITSDFGKRINPLTKKEENHAGIDIDAKIGTDVRAVYDGTVETVENSKTMGLMLVIDHNNGFKTTYGHLSESNVNEGEMITKGSSIALTGNSGNSTGPHLHFEVYKNGKAVNPIDYLKNN